MKRSIRTQASANVLLNSIDGRERGTSEIEKPSLKSQQIGKIENTDTPEFNKSLNMILFNEK